MHKTQTEDTGQDIKNRAERVDGSKIGRNTQRIRDEHADGSKIGARNMERIIGEFPDGSQVESR